MVRGGPRRLGRLSGGDLRTRNPGDTRRYRRAPRGAQWLAADSRAADLARGAARARWRPWRLEPLQGGVMIAAREGSHLEDLVALLDQLEQQGITRWSRLRARCDATR